jgi:hypothetical protein
MIGKARQLETEKDKRTEKHFQVRIQRVRR